jgi:hypothetical protein
MALEDIEIRITRSGEIYVKIDGVTEQRVRDYKLFLEEHIGPLLGSEVIRRPDWEQPAGWVNEEDERRKREQELRRG